MNEPIVQEPLAFIDLQKQRARLDADPFALRPAQRLGDGDELTLGEIESRFEEFKRMTHFEPVPLAASAAGALAD